MTGADKRTLDAWQAVAVMLGRLLGKGCEVVLHSLEDLQNSVVFIVNGEITGRKVGSPVTNTALAMLQRIQEEHIDVTEAYFTRSPDGHLMRSITCAIRGSEGNVAGLLCVNLDIDTPLCQFMQDLLPPRADEKKHPAEAEVFAHSVDELVRETVETVRHNVINDPAISPSARNRCIILRLHEQGLFELKDAVIIIAGMLGISRHTVYLHLRKMKAT
ncbi:hypothetical protein EL06_21110 [Salmonella enterica subsp. diarizonae]|uniref:Transcriptional regulator n=1 Tax=Salmonella diarizonae TaxID=59204 RepID=A0A6C8Y2W9_SALDZ|nr:hypothetical protein [Salmonella enterica subsp. diarizonae]